MVTFRRHSYVWISPLVSGSPNLLQNELQMTYQTSDNSSADLAWSGAAMSRLPVTPCDRQIHTTAMTAFGIFLMVACRSATAISDEAAEFTKEVCIVQDPLISEASGLAVSRTTPNAVWLHNDSGDLPRLFLIGLQGTTLGIVNVKDVTATDWEDICSFELDDASWLLVGDIGDNQRMRGTKSRPCQLLLLKEPKLKLPSATKMIAQSTVEVVRRIEFQFPDGAHDCESLAVDTVSRTILLVTKADPFESALYSLPLALTTGKESLTAERLAPLGVTYATAMDVSSDGRHLAIVNMFSGVMLTREDPEKQSWAEASRGSITVLTLPIRKQGESVCFTGDGNSLLLNSEGKSQPLWQVQLKTTE